MTKQTRNPRSLLRDEGGAVMVEAAFAFPILIVLLLGMVTYGMWFAAAHALQEGANSAARSTLGALDAGERDAQVDKTVARMLASSSMLNPAKVETDTSLDGTYYSVTLTYDISEESLFANSIVPLPGDTIVRSALVEVSGS
ncbi:TadE/TadG family type IV pilus assembly protein [Tsuneonella sp. HG222]